MLLSELLRGVCIKESAYPDSEKRKNYEGYEDVEILDLQTDSAMPMKGAAFICIKGHNADGHAFAEAAFKKGAAAIISQKPLPFGNVILTEDTKEAYALMCRNFFKLQENEQPILIAATGTNGKTTVATLVAALMGYGGYSCGLISTIQASYGGRTEELARTTPDSYTLNRLLLDMTKCGMKAVSMEASSHALDQKRLFGLRFNAAIFTNLSQDHLDYHENMLEYFKAKKKLFDMADFAVINIDNSYGKELAAELTIPLVTYSTENGNADFWASEISCQSDGVSFLLNHKEISCRVRFAIPGIYSVQNALAAIATCAHFNIPLCRLAEGLARINGIRGRSEVIKTGKGFTVLCDYAHTPDGIENILRSTRSYTSGRITLLFGCGGDRDREKRPIMGKIAAALADFVIVTSDNPRREMPNRIIGEILKGIPMDARSRCIAIPDRRDAIRYALDTARIGDTIILAGKGHEQYQVLGDKKLYFDERKLVEGILHSLS